MQKSKFLFLQKGQKKFKKWKKMSRTDDLADKRIEKLNDSEKKSC